MAPRSSALCLKQWFSVRVTLPLGDTRRYPRHCRCHPWQVGGHWHVVGRGQGYCSMSYNAQGSLCHWRIIQTQISVGPRLRKPCLEPAPRSTILNPVFFLLSQSGMFSSRMGKHSLLCAVLCLFLPLLLLSSWERVESVSLVDKEMLLYDIKWLPVTMEKLPA